MDLPRGYDLKAIRAFVHVAESGSMTEAAKRLGLTQSTVSQTIVNLEESLGAPLLDRSMRPLTLTPAGTVLLDQGRRLLDQAAAVLRDIGQETRDRLPSLTLALVETFANTVGPLLVREMMPAARHWRIWAGITPHVQEALTARRVDAIVTTGSDLDDAEGLERHVLCREPFVLALPAADRRPLARLDDLADTPFIRLSLRSVIGRQIEGQLGRLHLNLPFFVEFDTATGQLAAVADGMGWTITTPLCLAQEHWRLPHLRVEPLPHGRFRRRLTLIARAGALGPLPAKLAEASRRLIREPVLAPLLGEHPWIAGDMRWPETETEG
ncbi:MAG: LysR family transcriptional regulator [Hyphomicrobiales bacterium]|nr:LysR family transcriptional regulator [Hyphomicrobiales bacterium]